MYKTLAFLALSIISFVCADTYEITLKCMQTQGIGADDTYITVNGNRVWGVVHMDEGETQNFRLVVSPHDLIQIWEEDKGDDDLIGSFHLPDQQNPIHVSGDGSSYWVYYKKI